MHSIQTSHMFSLSSVKPLEGLLRYRQFCVEATRKALLQEAKKREESPVSPVALEKWGEIEKLEYLRCPVTGSLFLAHLPPVNIWAKLLQEVSCYRNSSQNFHADIKASRLENVFWPKLDWIQNTLRLYGVKTKKILEVVTLPSSFAGLLQEQISFAEVAVVDEMKLLMGEKVQRSFDVAILLESLDRVSDPKKLIKCVVDSLGKGGMVFVTSLVASGFDMTVLGEKNAYLYPPDRTNCFSLNGLKRLLQNEGLQLLEASTPGVLDVEIVQAHCCHDSAVPLSSFEKRLVHSDLETRAFFQEFLQRSCFSSFARIVAQKK